MENKGRIIYVEPTEIGEGSQNGYVSPLEDYSIYVDLEIVKNDRYACGMPDSTGKNGSKVFRTSEKNKSFMKGSGGILTTNYTDVNVLTNDANTDECIGIKSITIDYTSWQCPTVSIVFVDVRGTSLMGKNEAYQNGTGKEPSFFNEMFMMPYPLFKLTVKGFYGQPVKINLMLKDTAIGLDSNTGNFEVKANFVAYMYGVFADMPMTLLACAPYVTYNGKNIWDEMISSGKYYFLNGNERIPMMKFPELRLKLAQLAENEDYVNALKEKEDRIAELEERKAALQDLVNSFPCRGWYEVEGYDYLIKINYISENNKKEDIDKTLNTKISDFKKKLEIYDERYSENNRARYNCFAELKNYTGVIYTKTLISNVDDVKIKDGIAIRDAEKISGYNDYGEEVKEYTGAVNEAQKIHDNPQYGKIIQDAIKGAGKNGFYLQSCKKNSAETLYEDCKDLREKLTEIDSELNSIDSEYKDVANQVAADFLGFPPTIRNFYNMAFAHMETFARFFYEATREINDELDGNGNSRKPSTYGIGLEDTDINRSLGNTLMPPFTAIYSKTDKEGKSKKELVWPGELNNGSNLPEVNLVNAIVEGAKLYTTTEYNNQKLIEAAEKNEDTSINGNISEFLPLTYYDFAHFNGIRNPYQYAASLGRSGDDITGQILLTFLLRAFYYLKGNQSTVFNNEAQAFGVLDALNLYKAFGEDMTPSFIRFYNDLTSGKYNKNTFGDGEKWNFLNNTVLSNNLNCYVWFKEGGDMVLPVANQSLKQLQTEIAGAPDINPNEKYINISNLGNNKGYFHLFPSRRYVRDIITNVSSINFGEFDDDLDVYRKERVIRNLANNMDGEYDAKWNIWVNKFTFYDGTLMEKHDDGEISGAEKNNIISAMQTGENKNLAFRNVVTFEDSACSLYGHPFYWLQTDMRAKAFLFIFSVRYAREQKTNGIKPSVENGAVPLVELLREGAMYWKEDDDTINTSGEVDFSFGLIRISGSFNYKRAGTNEFYCSDKELVSNPIAYPNGSKNEYKKFITPKGCRKERREKLKQLFIDWADNKYSQMDILLSSPDVYDLSAIRKSGQIISSLYLDYEKAYGGGISDAERKCERLSRLLKDSLLDVYTVIDTTDGMQEGNNAQDVCLALSGFTTEIKKIYDGLVNGTEAKKSTKSQISEAFDDKDLRLSTYLTLKNLYDRWFCCDELEKWVLNVEHKDISDDDYSDSASYFNRFAYMDSFYHNVGDRLLVNGAKVSDLLSKSIPSSDGITENPSSVYQGQSLYKFLVDVAIAGDGQLLPLPVFYGMKTVGGIEDMFKANLTGALANVDRQSFVFLYPYRPSQHLRTQNGYRYDGIDLTADENDLPPCLADNSDGNAIPAFGVTFARQNQSFFKNITLNTEQPQTSEIGLFATMDIASKSSESPRETTLYGQDIYRIFSSNSYECTVEMMGDAQILPLMYFQLNGIPMWNGAYMIMQVSHTITPGNMVTTFKGQKISRNALPMSEGTTITLNTTGFESGNENGTGYYSGEDISYITNVNEMAENVVSGADNASAAYQVWNHIFNVLHLGAKGLCSKYTYQMAAAFVGINVRFGSNGTSAGGNANDESYWKNLEKLGYTRVYDTKYSDNMKSSMMRAEVNKLKAQPGDVVVYYSTKGTTSDSCCRYGHTQFYVGEKQGWASSVKDNYNNGTSFVYSSKSNCYGWRLIHFRAPKAGCKKG